MNRERALVDRRQRLTEAVRLIQLEIKEVDAQLGAERVQRIAELDARIALQEQERRDRLTHDRNPPHPAIAHEERYE